MTCVLRLSVHHWSIHVTCLLAPPPGTPPPGTGTVRWQLVVVGTGACTGPILDFSVGTVMGGTHRRSNGGWHWVVSATLGWHCTGPDVRHWAIPANRGRHWLIVVALYRHCTGSGVRHRAAPAGLGWHCAGLDWWHGTGLGWWHGTGLDWWHWEGLAGPRLGLLRLLPLLGLPVAVAA